MSRGCPPELRAQRDWEALPLGLRQQVEKVRAAVSQWPRVTVSGSVRGIHWIVTLSNGRRHMALDYFSLTLARDPSAPLACALRRIGAAE